jgi:hypothetical protein
VSCPIPEAEDPQQLAAPVSELGKIIEKTILEVACIRLR